MADPTLVGEPETIEELVAALNLLKPQLDLAAKKVKMQAPGGGLIEAEQQFQMLDSIRARYQARLDYLTGFYGKIIEVPLVRRDYRHRKTWTI